MFTNDLAEVIAIEGRILSVQPLGNRGGVKPPVIHGVPLGLNGIDKFYSDVVIKVGNIIPIFYTTSDISNFLIRNNKDVTSCRENSYNSCFALPFTFSKESLNIPIPAELKEVGNKKFIGNLNHEGSQLSTEEIKSNSDVKAGDISLKEHDHNYTTPVHAAGEGATTPPNKG